MRKLLRKWLLNEVEDWTDFWTAIDADRGKYEAVTVTPHITVIPGLYTEIQYVCEIVITAILSTGFTITIRQLTEVDHQNEEYLPTLRNALEQLQSDCDHIADWLREQLPDVDIVVFTPT